MITDIKKIYSLMIVGLMVAAGGLVVVNTIDDAYANLPTTETIDGWTYIRILLHEPEVRISEYVGPPIEHLTVPSTLGSNIVTDLNGLFLHNVADTVRSVTISDGIKVIRQDAFKDCSVLANITIPDSVTEIGYRAFFDCTGLQSFTIPDSVTSIGDFAFSGCIALTSITIPDSVTSIGDYAFRDCTALTSITIPDSVTEIGSAAFRDCTALTSIILPNNHELDIRGFSSWLDNCVSLKTITIPENINNLYILPHFAYSTIDSYFESVTILGNPELVLYHSTSFAVFPELYYSDLTDIYITSEFKGDTALLTDNPNVAIIVLPTVEYLEPSSNNSGIVGVTWHHQLSNTPSVSVNISGDDTDWLQSVGGKISGIPPSNGVYEITVTLSAPGHLDVTETFTLAVVDQLALMNKPSAGVIAYAVS